MPRPRLHQILCTAFFNKKHKLSQAQCQENSVAAVQRKDFISLFDGYPLLICHDDLHALSYRFIDILGSIDPKEEVIRDENLIHQIDVLLADITMLGAAELFNSNGHLSIAILRIMGLTEYQDELKGHEIEVLSGYVRTVLQEVNHANNDDIKNEKTAAIFMKTMRLRCHEVVPREMKNPDLNVNFHNWVAETVNRIPRAIKEHPLEIALLFGSLGVLGTALFFSGRFLDSYINAAPMSKFKI